MLPSSWPTSATVLIPSSLFKENKPDCPPFHPTHHSQQTTFLVAPSCLFFSVTPRKDVFAAQLQIALSSLNLACFVSLLWIRRAMSLHSVIRRRCLTRNLRRDALSGRHGQGALNLGLSRLFYPSDCDSTSASLIHKHQNED
jgi:hypothetical protein